jgi:hypothetical protein
LGLNRKNDYAMSANSLGSVPVCTLDIGWPVQVFILPTVPVTSEQFLSFEQRLLGTAPVESGVPPNGPRAVTP